MPGDLSTLGERTATVRGMWQDCRLPLRPTHSLRSLLEAGGSASNTLTPGRTETRTEAPTEPRPKPDPYPNLRPNPTEFDLSRRTPSGGPKRFVRVTC
ncbi:hypothetical protein BN903_136 [Halorubrum sp. AJ67]|nr:hypothetical protein BN903_136 [Halorubrum sp. AJ67]